MAMELFFREKEGSTSSGHLHLLASYESGEVALHRCSTSHQERSIEGRGWTCIWKTRQHVESGRQLHSKRDVNLNGTLLAVMAMSISPDRSFALTVSADHLVVRYNLFVSPELLSNNYPCQSMICGA